MKMRATKKGNRPSTKSAVSKQACPRNEFAWQACVSVANHQKKWAQNLPAVWFEMASNMSIEMAQRYLDDSIEDIADHIYQHLEHRANLTGRLYGQESYLDQPMRSIWVALAEGDDSLLLKHYGVT